LIVHCLLIDWFKTKTGHPSSFLSLTVPSSEVVEHVQI